MTQIHLLDPSTIPGAQFTCDGCRSVVAYEAPRVLLGLAPGGEYTRKKYRFCHRECVGIWAQQTGDILDDDE